MTTTLRPAGPLQSTAEGARSRPYEVRVNSRVVGKVELAADPAAGPAVGLIRGLWIDRPDRRRGRGTVAALAAEEVLRGWGCRRIDVAVPGDAAEARRMAGALGYTETGRHMVKRVSARPPALPAGDTGRPMTAGEFEAWLGPAVEGYAEVWRGRGLPPGAALARSREAHEERLPRGLDTPGTSFSVLESGGVPVGHVWVGFGVAGLPGDPGAYVFDVAVDAAHRGRGHGRSLMLLAEGAALAGRARLIGLHVLVSNTPARRLYESLGYRIVQHNFTKPLI
ncbi:GNAT family N-acetyltransferase [Streptomyces sp. NPDC101132]|uniref:GNAT family N-acetyltransferase n=1 Tax=Streptomyces sp. NPDC101132 TaxID=3366110 RepID=UPI0038173BB8